MHSFHFPEEVFNGLFEQSIRKHGKILYRDWEKLCGVYFRYPHDDYGFYYAYDHPCNKESDTSFSSWLRKQYCRPFFRDYDSEGFDESQASVESFRKNNPKIPVNYYFEEYEKAKRERKRIEHPLVSIDDLTLEQREEHSMLGCRDLLERLSISDIIPKITNTLDYFYDYGDDWHVIITYKGEIAPKDDWKNNIACLYADGLPVMDDVGGGTGYSDFLNKIHGHRRSTVRDLLDWAQEMEWTGREIKAERML